MHFIKQICTFKVEVSLKRIALWKMIYFPIVKKKEKKKKKNWIH